MRTLVVVMSLLAFQSASLGRSEDTGVPFVAYWSIGDSYQFNIERTQQQWKNGAATKDRTTEYLATFTVIDSTESSYTIKWTYKSDLEMDQIVPASFATQLRDYGNMEILYRTNEVGEFQEVLNWQEIGSKMENLISEMLEIVGRDTEINKDEFKERMEPLLSVYRSKEGIEQILMKEIQLIHFPMGYEFSMDESVEYDDELPNMFGGKPIKAKGKLTVAEFDEEETRCKLVHELALDPKEVNQLMLQMMKELGVSDKEVQKQMKGSRFDIQDKNVFDYVYDPCVPLRIEAHRETIITFPGEDGRRIDRTVIELVDN